MYAENLVTRVIGKHFELIEFIWLKSLQGTIKCNTNTVELSMGCCWHCWCVFRVFVSFVWLIVHKLIMMISVIEWKPFPHTLDSEAHRLKRLFLHLELDVLAVRHCNLMFFLLHFCLCAFSATPSIHWGVVAIPMRKKHITDCMRNERYVCLSSAMHKAICYHVRELELAAQYSDHRLLSSGLKCHFEMDQMTQSIPLRGQRVTSRLITYRISIKHDASPLNTTKKNKHFVWYPNERFAFLSDWGRKIETVRCL